MKLSESLEDLLAQHGAQRAQDSEYRHLRELYDRLKSEGRVKQPEYELPPPDTIGRIFFLQFKNRPA